MITKLTTRCRECATVSVGVCWLVAIGVGGSFIVSGNRPIEGATLSNSNSTQELMPPPQVNELLAPPHVEAPVPSTESLQKPREDVEVLARGPLHEAFASVHQTNPAAGPVIEQRPPDPIEELLPEYKPDGENIEWISGYWSFDDVAAQFIWISGLWREIPPGQRWVPGYWEEVKPGFRWVSGFWTSAEVDELSYLPSPPASLEQGPSAAAPGENYFYSPGNWVYRSNAYQWQPGYWQPCVDNWVWVPARYIWTPCGYVFCPGYWDRLFVERGVCFAPVRFLQPAYYRPQFYYRPVCRIVTDVNIFVHLFVRPSCGHYYFGDWYGDHYARRDYCAWVDYSRRYRGYDSLYSYYHYGHTPYRESTVIDWAASQHRICEARSDHRPKHTFHAEIAARSADPRRSLAATGEPSLVEDFGRHVRQAEVEGNARAKSDRARFHRVNDDDKKTVQSNIKPMRELQVARREVETARRQKIAPANEAPKLNPNQGRVQVAKPEVKLPLPKTSVARHPRTDEPRGRPAAEHLDLAKKPDSTIVDSVPGTATTDLDRERRGRGMEKKPAASAQVDVTPPTNAANGPNTTNRSKRIEPKTIPQNPRSNEVRSAHIPQTANKPTEAIDRSKTELSPGKIRPIEPRSNEQKSFERSRDPNLGDNPSPRARSSQSVERSSPRVNNPAPTLPANPSTNEIRRGRPTEVPKRFSEQTQSAPTRAATKQIPSQPRIERSTPPSGVERSSPQSRLERSSPQPRVERATPQPRAERSTPQVQQPPTIRQSNHESRMERSSSDSNRGSESRRSDRSKKD